MTTVVNPSTLAAPRGYSNGLLMPAGQVLFVAGQIGWTKEAKLVDGGMAALAFWLFRAQATPWTLLGVHGVGLIATSPTDIRVAFSCLEVDDVEPLFEAMHKAIQELR